MKTLEELLKEIGENEALKTEFEAAADSDKLVDFLKKNDCEATVEELVEYVLSNKPEGAELDEEELESVAGGRDKKCVTLFGKKLCI